MTRRNEKEEKENPFSPPTIALSNVAFKAAGLTPLQIIMAFGPFAFGMIGAWFLWNNMVAPQLVSIAAERDKIYSSSMAATAAADAAKQAAEAARKTAEANQATAQVLQHITDQLTRVSEKIGYVQGRDGKDK